MRKTKQLKLLLNEFNQKEDAISIVELVNKFSDKMNKTTVYRILDRFEKDSILHSFVDKYGLKRYAKNKNKSNPKEAHPHFLCEDCGTTSCIPINIKIPTISNYRIKTSEHLLIGQCKNCLS
jgi:Fur family ferric uptake transcriptional regulator